MGKAPNRQRWLQRSGVTNVVSSDIWEEMYGDEISWEAKLVRMYIATCQSRTVEGIFPLPMARIVKDTGLDASVVDDALELLSCCHIIAWDGEEELVFDPAALEAARLGSSVDDDGRPKDKRVIGAVAYVSELPESIVLQAFSIAAHAMCPPLGDLLDDAGIGLGWKRADGTIHA